MAPGAVKGRIDARRRRAPGWKLVTHGGDFGERSQLRLRVSVAVEAPRHGQGEGLSDRSHFIDPPVAAFATHPRSSVNRVIEEDEVGQVVNPAPTDRAVVVQALTERCNVWFGGVDLLMASHAKRGFRDARRR